MENPLPFARTETVIGILEATFDTAKVFPFRFPPLTLPRNFVPLALATPLAPLTIGIPEPETATSGSPVVGWLRNALINDP